MPLWPIGTATTQALSRPGHPARKVCMTDLALLAPAELAALLENAIQRLGQLGEPGIDALTERLAGRPDREDFDHGVDLLDQWIGDPDA